ncbi:unnamed protein product, partial [Clonostachys solani]
MGTNGNLRPCFFASDPLKASVCRGCICFGGTEVWFHDKADAFATSQLWRKAMTETF